MAKRKTNCRDVSKAELPKMTFRRNSQVHPIPLPSNVYYDFKTVFNEKHQFRKSHLANLFSIVLSGPSFESNDKKNMIETSNLPGKMARKESWLARELCKVTTKQTCHSFNQFSFSGSGKGQFHIMDFGGLLAQFATAGIRLIVY